MLEITNEQLNNNLREYHLKAGYRSLMNIPVTSETTEYQLADQLHLDFVGYTRKTVCDSDIFSIITLEPDIGISLETIKEFANKNYNDSHSIAVFAPTISKMLYGELESKTPDYDRVHALANIVFHRGNTINTSAYDGFHQLDNTLLYLSNSKYYGNTQGIMAYHCMLKAIGEQVSPKLISKLSDILDMVMAPNSLLGQSISDIPGKIWSYSTRLPIPLMGKLLSRKLKHDKMVKILAKHTPDDITRALSLSSVSSIKAENAVYLIKYAELHDHSELRSLVLNKCSDGLVTAYYNNDTSYPYKANDIRLPSELNFIHKWHMEVVAPTMINDYENEHFNSFINHFVSLKCAYSGHVTVDTIYQIYSSAPLYGVFDPLFNESTHLGGLLIGISEITSRYSGFGLGSDVDPEQYNSWIMRIRPRIRELFENEPQAFARTLSIDLIHDLYTVDDLDVWFGNIDNPEITDSLQEMLADALVDVL